jgi:cobalt-zinc-cadmium efflux system protein
MSALPDHDHDHTHDHDTRGAADHAAHAHGNATDSGHDHSAHGHAGHDHGPAGGRALVWALGLTAAFAVVEALGGFAAGSLALVSDAGHMAADAGSLGLALFAQRVALRPPSSRASYGYARAEVLAAFVNALAMLLIVAVIVYEAVRRLAAPEPVQGGLVVWVGLAGLAVNLVAARILWGAGESVNLRAALLHVMGDVLGSIAAVLAGVVIIFTGWLPIDPLLSILISLLIVRSTWQLLCKTTAVLMEGVPAHLSYPEIGKALAGLPGVQDVHDLHVWHMGSADVALSAHIGLSDGAHWPSTLASAQRLLRERYGIAHVTLQPDWPLPQPKGVKIIPLVPRN